MGIDKLKYMVASGCSHFAGSEIVEPGNGLPDSITKRKAIPGRIAEKLELNYINLAVPGGSNGYIFRSIIDWVSKYIEQGRDPAELLVCVGWSTDERTEFTWDDEHYHWATGSCWESYYDNGRGPDFKNWFKALQLYHTDFAFGRYKKIINIITLDTFLKKHGIKHVQLATCGRLPENVWELKELRSFEHLFPNDVFFEPTDSFIDQYKESYKERFTDWLHADEYLHNLYSTKVVEFIKEMFNE